MFCDLVGSTELARRIDPEELREIVREYRAVCAEATKRFDGHVAQYLGDGVMVYFGWPQAHEDDAGRAIRAGLEIQRLLGERPEGLRDVEEGLALVDASGSAAGRELVYALAAQVYRMAKRRERADEVLDRAGDRSFHHGHVCIARAQVRSELGDGAPAESPRTGKLREAHDRLAHHYGRLTEGLERGPAREARAALDELAARLDAGTPVA